MRKQKAHQDDEREADLLTSRERGVLSLMREGLNDEQIAERLGIDVATAQYDVWGILSKLGLESRAQVALSRPQVPPAPDPEPQPEAQEPEEPEAERPAEQAPYEQRPRINFRLAAQVAGAVFALIGVGLIVLGVLRSTGDGGDGPAVVRTALPFGASAGATSPPITPVPTATSQDPDLLGQFPAGTSQIFTLRPTGQERSHFVQGSFPQWSPDGQAIAFASGNREGDLFLLSASGGDIRALPASISAGGPPPPDAGCHARPFQWSPDGARLAVCNARSGNIDIIRLSGEGPIFIGSGSSFSWSPDGDSITFTGYEGEGAAAQALIYIADPLQPDAPPLILAEGTTPDWSPDGANIAYVANDGLHVAAVDGSADNLVAPGEIARSHVSWSPDGTRIAYVSAGRIHIAAADASGIDLDLGEGLAPQWSPDSAQIAYYTSAPNGQDDIWAVPAGASSPPRHLGKGRSLAWSPDSTRLASDRLIP